MSLDADPAQAVDTSATTEESDDNAPLLGEADFYESPEGFAEVARDPKNAGLYTDRAQYFLKNDRIEEALADAEKATALEPTSVDAWSCLAKVQHRSALFRESINSYKRAQANMPTEADMSESDKKLKAELHASIMEVLTDATKDNGLKPKSVAKRPDVKPPWERAALVAEKLMYTFDTKSSAWVIYYAHETFNHAAEFICEGDPKQWKMMPYPPGSITPAAQSLLEGIMRDPRCFVDKPELRSRLQYQLVVELKAKNGWDHDCPIERVQVEIKHRVRVKGWEGFKTALRASIQDWILAAFMVYTFDRNPAQALKYYTKAIAMIDFVRETWPDASASDRGAICENSFLFPLKRLALRAYLDPKHSGRTFGPLLAAVEKFATSLVREAKAELSNLGPLGLSSSERLSYWVYPIAEGNVALGWVHYCKAKNGSDENKNFRIASEFYVIAANDLDEDEENHAYFLALAIDCMWRSKSPLSKVLPLCDRIRSSAPKMRKIWSNSQMSATRDARIQQILKFDTEHKGSIERGEETLDDIAVPKNWDAGSEVEVFV